MGTGSGSQVIGPREERGARPRWTASVLEAWGPVDHSGREDAAADGGAGLQAELGCGPGRAVDQSGNTPTGGVLELEEAVDEGVQEVVVVAEEDANREESGGAEDGVDDVASAEGGPHRIASVPIVEGVGWVAVAGVDLWILPVHLGAGAGVWRQLQAASSKLLRARVARWWRWAGKASMTGLICMLAVVTGGYVRAL